MQVEWKSRQLVPTRAAYYELMDLGFDLWDVLEILEMGERCGEKKRKEGTVEACLKKGKKIYKVVVVESKYLGGPAWRIIHVGGL